MHEFSLALNIVDVVTEYAVKENALEVREVEIEVGELSGVVREALEFALKSAVKGTLLEKAECHIKIIKGEVRCNQCQFEFETNNFYTECPECHSYSFEIIKGKELRVASIVIE
ncbi:MAG: hypothetical protein AMS27_11225 [Bacteroides sp. SM23_62_1]|nr:MAG: hypothetical protein AMS27_11225 [Bacteroides sp. SM23_62_1]